MMARPARSWLCASYPDATSTAAITGLSYTAISTGCPIEYQHFQVSPPRPDALRTPSAAHQQGLRSTVSSSPQPGFPPVRNRQGLSCRHEARFRVAQPRPFGRPVDWVEPGDSPGAPYVCRASSIRSTRLRQWQPDSWRLSGLPSVGSTRFLFSHPIPAESEHLANQRFKERLSTLLNPAALHAR